MTTDQAGNAFGKTDRIVVAGLIAVCLIIYAQVFRFEFINLDDNLYVYDNPYITAGVNLISFKWAFTTFHSANWHPLTWISHMIDATLFGPNAGGHHIVNVLFHAANSVIAYFVFKRMTGSEWKSAMVAALFAVHPAHVESVAWVSERKDVLSTLFWLLTMLAYIEWTRRSAEKGTGVFSVQYLLVVVAFILGLLSKPMLVTLPFVLLLIDSWPLGRLCSLRDLRPRVLEKLPLFVLAAVSSFITLRAQSAYSAVVTVSDMPLAARFENVILSYVKYLGMLFYPVDLAIGYAHVSISPLQLGLAALLLIAVTVACVWQRKDRPYLIVGWLWFLGTMVPVIGFVQVGSQSMADRYTYVPYFGLFIMLVWGAAEILRKLDFKTGTAAVVALLPILYFSALAFNQTSYWRTGYDLYSHALATGKTNFITMHNMCSVLTGQRRLAEAEAQCLAAIATEPRFVDTYNLLGMIHASNGKYQEAVNTFDKAIEIDPNNAMSYSNAAVPLTLLEQADDAESRLDKAVELYRAQGADPAFLAVHYSNVAGVLARQKKYDRAADVLRKAIAIAPNRADIRANLAMMLYFLDHTVEAREEIDQSVSMNPSGAEIQNILGMILLKQGDSKGAAQAFERAVTLRPDFAEAKENLEKARGASPK